ncbi:MAG: metalloregulator ArsR/SmtB family transcription factor [Nitrospirota bacterium]
MLNDNPTRERILLLLKRRGNMSIDDLSRELSITSMGIRQHLLSLERKGLIDFMTKRQGIGRPAFLYKLTQKADELFPKRYCEFVVDMLKDIEKNEGLDKVNDIFKWRKNRLMKEMKDALSDKKTFQDRVTGLRDVLESKGYYVDLSSVDGNYVLKQFNCPIARLASEYREACQFELQMYRDILGKDVNREECLAEGSPSCTYVIPKTSRS